MEVGRNDRVCESTVQPLPKVGCKPGSSATRGCCLTPTPQRGGLLTQVFLKHRSEVLHFSRATWCTFQPAFTERQSKSTNPGSSWFATAQLPRFGACPSRPEPGVKFRWKAAGARVHRSRAHSLELHPKADQKGSSWPHLAKRTHVLRGHLPCGRRRCACRVQ